MILNSSIPKLDKSKIIYKTGIKFIRGLWKRLFLARAQGLLLIGKHVTLSHASHIFCGKNVKFEDYSEVQGLCEKGLHFGDEVTIGRGVMIRPSSYYGKDLGQGLYVGNRSSIGPYGYIGCSGLISIGNNVMIGPKCSFFAENHIFASAETAIKDQGVSQKGITIDDDCWIGSNVTILDGVHIGKHVVIGAGTLVTKDIPDNTIVFDKRMRYLRKLGE